MLMNFSVEIESSPTGLLVTELSRALEISLSEIFAHLCSWAVLLPTVKLWTQPRSPATKEWIKYYLDTHWIFQSKSYVIFRKMDATRDNCVKAIMSVSDKY